jgi:hypothetical protein
MNQKGFMQSPLYLCKPLFLKLISNGRAKFLLDSDEKSFISPFYLQLIPRLKACSDAEGFDLRKQFIDGIP